MFEDLPIKLTNQEELVLRTIVDPESSKAETRRSAISLVIVIVVMPLAIWGLFYIPMGDLSEYESLADSAYAILPLGVILWTGYRLIQSMRIRDQLIQKLVSALNRTDSIPIDTESVED